jgi:hypothetical protein
MPAPEATARITWNAQFMVSSVYFSLANHRLYGIDLHTDDINWTDCRDLLNQAVEPFAFTANSAVQ